MWKLVSPNVDYGIVLVGYWVHSFMVRLQKSAKNEFVFLLNDTECMEFSRDFSGIIGCCMSTE